ncbi:MAG TPA: hypothetical protein VHO69_03785 [Phototrophicaceae bacterium]|nr:hypothetical protein [Phototrophicaceae bacterium]
MEQKAVQHLNTLWQAVNAASQVAELARQSQTFHFGVTKPVTFYLQAEGAEVRIKRWLLPQIDVTVQLQAAFGWRIATDQDDAGVYVVAKRRPVVGGLSRATFSVAMPADIYLILKLADGRVVMDGVSGTLSLPPANLKAEMVIRQEN